MLTYKRFRIPHVADYLLWLQYFIYFFTLLLIYVHGVAPTYAYMGFQYGFSFENLLISIACLFFCMPLLKPNGQPSAFFLTLAASVVLVPSLVIYTGAGLPHRFALLTLAAILLISITNRIVKLKPIKTLTVSISSLTLLFTLISITTICLIFAFGGAKHFNLNLSLVYDLREDAAASLPGVFGYINSITSKIIIPFAMVFAAMKRNWFALLFLSLLSVLMFALTAHKSPLFYPLVIGFVYLIAGKRYLHHILLIGLTAILLISALDLWAQRSELGGISGWFSSLFTRRALLLPSLLNWYHLDYFQDIPKYFWAHSKLSLGLLEPSHELTSANLVGLEYFGRETAAANTGWIGSGYANGGVPGILIYSVAIGVLFSFLDAYSRRIGNRTVIALFVLPIFSILASSDLVTMLLTHGLLLSLLILTMIQPAPGNGKQQL